MTSCAELTTSVSWGECLTIVSCVYFYKYLISHVLHIEFEAVHLILGYNKAHVDKVETSG